MKIYPVKKDKRMGEGLPGLTMVEQRMKQIALTLALVSVFIFFFKIVFF